jgi:2-oxoglutarate ferredoxin oxidoreductase subunit alpha
VPVFVLTDQFLLDSSYNIPDLDIGKDSIQKQFVQTSAKYQRYALTDDGISPRGIPGNGEGLVVVDSDEHDEEGHITEDLLLRTRMVDKRLKRKLAAIRRDAERPRLVGPKDYDLLVVTWGSNYHVVREAIRSVDTKTIAMLHFTQVYPLHRSTGRYLDAAGRIAIVENNARSQFGSLILLETGHRVDDNLRLLKYNGLPFAVEEVVSFLRKATRRR